MIIIYYVQYKCAMLRSKGLYEYYRCTQTHVAVHAVGSKFYPTAK